MQPWHACDCTVRSRPSTPAATRTVLYSYDYTNTFYRKANYSKVLVRSYLLVRVRVLYRCSPGRRDSGNSTRRATVPYCTVARGRTRPGRGSNQVLITPVLYRYLPVGSLQKDHYLPVQKTMAATWLPETTPWLVVDWGFCPPINQAKLQE